MRSLKNLVANALTLAVVLALGYGVYCSLDALGQKTYIVGDPVSEHIDKCEHCSQEWAIIHECPEAVRINIEYQRRAKVK